MMKPINASLITKAVLLSAGLALAASAHAQTITWDHKDVELTTKAKWYHPKITSDDDGDFVIVGFQDGTSLGPIAYWTGNNTYGETTLDGVATSTEYAVGASPSAAMAWVSVNGNYSGAVVDVHQGGQRNGAALWSHLAPFSGLPIGPTLTFTDGQEYDTGYHASVAANQTYNALAGPLPELPTALVEVHQAGTGYSDLWYHVGTLSVNSEGTISLVWGPSYKFDEGSLPSVAVCYYNGNGGSTLEPVAIEVHQGSNGTLWYSTGVINDSNQIAWNKSIKYDDGYAPSVACVQGIATRFTDVVEVHQAGNPAAGDSTALWYHVAPFTPSTVGWTPAQKYDTGCSPTVALVSTYVSQSQQLSIVETHSKTCGELGPLFYDFGEIPVS
jgi:hypothetical protein